MKKIILFDYLSEEEFYLTQEYGTNKYLDYTKYGLLWHEGEDYGDRTDPKPIVRALHDGVVVRDVDTPKDNYGDYVVIWDDVQNIATWYCHLESNSVSVGQRVKAGDIIGIMGSTGNVTAKHLHLNLVLTDSNGARLYKTKEQNLGFLDPHGKVFPPNVPKYEVVWLKPGENMSEENISVPKQDFEKIVTNSGKWDETVKYLEIQEDPATTPFEKVRSVIAGFKSRLTDLASQVTKALAEITNREEQVSRLKSQLLDEQKLAKDQYDKLNETLRITESQRDSLEGRIKALQGQVDILAKEKGQAISDKAVAEADLATAVEKYKTLLSEHTAILTWSQRIQVLLTGRLL